MDGFKERTVRRDSQTQSMNEAILASQKETQQARKKETEQDKSWGSGGSSSDREKQRERQGLRHEMRSGQLQ